MSLSRGRGFTSYTIRTKTIIGIILSLIVVGSICTLLTFPRALAAPIVSDDFNDNSLDTAKWDTNLFSGFTNTNVPIAETSQRLEVVHYCKMSRAPLIAVFAPSIPIILATQTAMLSWFRHPLRTLPATQCSPSAMMSMRIIGFTRRPAISLVNVRLAPLRLNFFRSLMTPAITGSCAFVTPQLAL